MIEQSGNSIKFLGFFTASKTGKTGLTVTVDVRSPSGTLVVTAGAASEMGGGFYSYTLASGSVTTEGEYTAVFKTSDSTVDQQHIPSLWVVGRAGIENLDAAISSRNSTVPPTAVAIRSEIDTNSTKLANLDASISSRLAAASYTTPPSAATVSAQVWSEATRSLTDKAGFSLSASGVTAIQSGLFLASSYTAPDNAKITAIYADYQQRGVAVTLPSSAPDGYGGSTAGGLTEEQATKLDGIYSKTQLITAGAITISSPVSVSGNAITAKAGDSWSMSLSNLGSLTSREKLWFAVKRKATDADSNSLLFIEETGGLTVVKRATYSSTSNGVLIVSDASAGNVTVTVDEVVTAELGADAAVWAIKVLTADGTATTLAAGAFAITQKYIEATA